jgi:hypothetical protein
MFTDGFEKTANFMHTLKRVNSFVNPLKYKARPNMGESLLKRTKALSLGGVSNLKEIPGANGAAALKPKTAPLKSTYPAVQQSKSSVEKAFSGKGSNRLGLSNADMAASRPAEVERAKALATEGKLDQSSVAAISKNQEEAAKKLKEQTREKVIARHKRLVGNTTPWAYRHPYITGAGVIAGTKFISNNTGPRQQDPVEYPQQGA